MAGAVVAYVFAHHYIIRKHGIPTLKLADIVAPCAALGLCLGRIGCLLNGCCYGGVACPQCPQVRFPLSGMPRTELVREGYQTAAGFTLADLADNSHTVGAVEPESPASHSGLQTGDLIVEVDGHEIRSQRDLGNYFMWDWPRGKNDLELAVQRDGATIILPPFSPYGIGLHPTQVYESISTGLLLLLLLEYLPFRRHDGELMALFLILYPIHRFLNEVLRNDTRPLGDGMTLSQNGSILVLAVGLVLLAWLRRLPAQYHSQGSRG
jgi:phosphatidylglycerol:prolipoprotein diacylglycerol transferase